MRFHKLENKSDILLRDKVVVETFDDEKGTLMFKDTGYVVPSVDPDVAPFSLFVFEGERRYFSPMDELQYETPYKYEEAGVFTVVHCIDAVRRPQHPKAR